MRRPVLDSWAVVHLLDDGQRADVVQAAIDTGDAVMSWINLGEVAYLLQRRVDAETAREVVEDVRTSVDVQLPDPELVLAAAEIKATVRMSYADAFAVATALRVRGPVLTGDPELIDGERSWPVVDLRPGSPRSAWLPSE
ncbi:MAG: type II toxin-antitoxin system VapC family toxin [Phycicoccus sp.]